MSRIRVLNVFNSLMPSGAEVMWRTAAPHFDAGGVDHTIVATGLELGPYADQLRKHYEVVHLPLEPGVWGAARLATVARKLRANVIHCHSEAKSLASGFAGRRTGVPVVRTYHNVWPSTGMKHALRRRLDRRWTTRVAVGSSVAETEARWGPLDVVLNWVDVDAIAAKTSCEEAATPLRLLTVCNTNRFKRCDLMLEVLEKHPEVHFDHIGNDREGVFEPAALARRGLSERVRSLGPRNDVPSRLREYDAFVNTSDTEGFSIALCEALVAGLPLVIVDKPGVRDIRKFAPLAQVIQPEAHEPLRGLRASIERQRCFFRENQKDLHRVFGAQRGAAEYTALYRRLAQK